ncbi:uncharacterized protein LOC131225527 isoform X2 [Magnolia sinica]|uniref:uncharacterized protein LOC131225527 isoform X2 n=1 Tax=Magnolia sinica TaxID=86752 RepID=UPI0026580D2C|nr:uncharacterized protein LOC131225527 isoform X2 [Magnolia sinica]
MLRMTNELRVIKVICMLSFLMKLMLFARMLFELLVLTGAQGGMDWTSILRKRHDFRFDAEIVANFTERQIASVATDCNLDLNKVRGAINNANRILQVRLLIGPDFL